MQSSSNAKNNLVVNLPHITSMLESELPEVSSFRSLSCEDQEEEEEEDVEVLSEDDPDTTTTTSNSNDASTKRILQLRHSRYPNRTASVVFSYSPQHIEKMERSSLFNTSTSTISGTIDNNQDSLIETIDVDEDRNKVYEHLQYKTHWERNCVKNAFKQAGFDRSTSKNSSKWSAAWIKHLAKPKYSQLLSHQKVNHFPDSWIIGRKDRLMRCLTSMRRTFGADAFDFFPEGFSLPDQKDSFLRAVSRDTSKAKLWIMKPPASACGRGIKVISAAASSSSSNNNLSSIPKDKKRIVQKYIDNPCLVNGRKFDIRLYVLVTSFCPLRIHIFDEGLVRFCTSSYNTSNLKNRYSHLTNYSINVKSSEFEQNADAADDGAGSKWSLRALFAKLDEIYNESNTKVRVMKNIRDIVVKTIIAAESHITPLVQQYVPHRNNCYELFGFDFMLDDTLKAWIIEVNISPSLMGSSPLDQQIKGTLMADLFNLVGFTLPRNAAATGTSQKKSMNKKKVFSKKNGKPPQWYNIQKSFTKDDLIDFSDLSRITHDEWDIIHDLEDELERTGHFECIYPKQDTDGNYDQYGRFFACPRYYNTLCTKWLQHKKQFDLTYVPSNNGAGHDKCWKSSRQIEAAANNNVPKSSATKLKSKLSLRGGRSLLGKSKRSSRVGCL